LKEWIQASLRDTSSTEFQPIDEIHISATILLPEGDKGGRSGRDWRKPETKKVGYLFRLVFCNSAFEATSDLRVGGSNPSGRARDFSNLHPRSLMLCPLVSTTCFQTSTPLPFASLEP